MALNYIYHVYYNGKKVRHVFLLIMNNLRNNYAEIYSPAFPQANKHLNRCLFSCGASCAKSKVFPHTNKVDYYYVPVSRHLHVVAASITPCLLAQTARVQSSAPALSL